MLSRTVIVLKAADEQRVMFDTNYKEREVAAGEHEMVATCIVNGSMNSSWPR